MARVQTDVDEAFERVVAGMGADPTMFDPVAARRRLQVVRASALVAALVCAVAIAAAFGAGFATGLVAVAFSPVVVLSAVLTADHLLGG